MIQVMHTVADYVHDAKYKMPDRPLPCFYQGFLSKYCIWGQRNNLRDFIFKHII